MNIIKRSMLSLAGALSLMFVFAPAAEANNYGVNLVPNPSVETVSAADSTMPESWTKELYGDNTATFSYLTTGHTGSRSLRVDITHYHDGDSHFNFLSQPVTAEAEYDFSFWYQSNVTTEVDAEVLLTNGETVWVYFGDVPASATWKQYTATVTMPSGAAKANVYATIFSVGHLITDDYSFVALPATNDPVFSLAPGSYVGAQTLSITSATPGAKIYYTTNGRTPTASSALYAGPIGIAKTMTVKAIALIDGYADSAVLSGKYTIQANAPTFSPAEGTYAGTQKVAIADAMPGAKLYYTTNGNTPTVYSNLYSSPITISSTKTVKAIAVVSGCTKSAVASSKYTIVSQVAAAPTFSPGEGTYASTQTVSMTSATTGATIYYTVDGTDPTTASTPYATPVTVSSTTTVKAIATASGYANSPVTSALYSINMQTAAAPHFGLSEGKYFLDHLIPISSATPDALIYYTTDGTTPTSASTLYTAPVAFTASMTIKAIATATGYGDSAVASAVYTKGDQPAFDGVFSPPPGTYDVPQTVTISHGPENDCKDAMSDYSIVSSGGISFNDDGTFKVTSDGSITILFHTVYLYDAGTSEETTVLTYAYTINAPVPAAPTFSPGGGTYPYSQTVSMATDYALAKIYYTTDGTDPTTASTIYEGPITVSSSMTIKAITVLGSSVSPVSSAAYTILSYTLIEDDSVWLDGFNNGDIHVVTDDKVVGSSSIKMTTSAVTPESRSCGIYKDFIANPLNLSGTGIRFFVKSSDWSKVSETILSFIGPDAYNAFTYDIKQHLQNPANDEWIEMSVPMSDFVAIGSAPDWGSIVLIILALSDTGVSPADLSIDGFGYY